MQPDTIPPDLLEALLDHSAAVALQQDAAGCVMSLHNGTLLECWLEESPRAPDVAGVAALLQRLFARGTSESLQTQLEGLRASPGCSIHDLGVFPLRQGAPPRHVSVCARKLHDTADPGLLLVLRDVSVTRELQVALARSRAAAETSMALLRAPPEKVRLFLGSAMASISALRATQRMPARNHGALDDKLARLQDATGQLARDAQSAGLASITRACMPLLDSLHSLRHGPEISGDALLPLALLIDQIACAVGEAWRAEEQRHVAPRTLNAVARPASESARASTASSWAQSSEKRWQDVLRRRGEEIGTLARLSISGAECVPPAMRREVEEMMQHLLRNALEHGIETPEQRLAADKPAAGEIGVTFEDTGRAGIAITVRDDGRGFDLQRIGKAAVQCGLLSEESLVEQDPADLVRMIFKPAFTTDGVPGCEGHGRGMNFLRNAVTRLNGQISVATKAGRYTQFSLQLPVSSSPQHLQASAYA